MNAASLFSFAGRFSRRPYWVYGVVVPYVVALLAAILVTFATGTSAPRDGVSGPTIVVLIVLYVVFGILSVAAAAKRMHDLGRSGWWVLVNFVPVVGFFMFVWQGFFRGDVGPNAYGADPLGADDAPVRGPLALVGTGGQYVDCEFPLEQPIVIGTDARRSAVVIDASRYPHVDDAHCQLRPSSNADGVALYWSDEAGRFDRPDPTFDGKRVDLGDGLSFEVRSLPRH